MTKALFIHRSVGHHLLQYGGLRPLLNKAGITIDDYDNNLGLLTYNNGKTESGIIKMPGNNTNPDNLLDFFGQWPALLDSYDIITIKSCYPNSRIKDSSELEEIKATYSNIIELFKSHNKRLFVLTTPPLRPTKTNKKEAQLASELAYWLVEQLGANVFDLHHFYAETDGNHVGMLKARYRKLLPWDTHPNAKAHKDAAPVIADLISEATQS